MTHSYWHRAFSIDSRGLAAFRVGLGLLLLIDLALRAPDLVFLYSDEGVLPISVLRGEFSSNSFWSIHAWSGSWQLQALLFVVAALAALGLIFGFKTWVMTVISWVLCASLQNRNPLLLNAGDALLLTLLFWSMFLPLGQRWSMDAWRSSRAPEPPPARRSLLSVASAALLIQVVLMYLFAGLFKMNSIWLGGDGLYQTLGHQLYARPLAYTALKHGWLMWMGSVCTPFLQIGLSLSCFLPWKTEWIRYFVIAVVICFHLTLEFTLTTGLFAYVSFVGWIPFLPQSFWDWFERGRSPKGASRSGAIVTGAAGETSGTTSRSKGKWEEWALLALLVYVVLYNVDRFQRRSDRVPLMPEFAHKVANVTRMAQSWEMFSHPSEQAGWFVLTGTTADARRVDLIRGVFDPNDVRREQPDYPYRLFHSHRTRKYFNNMLRNQSKSNHPSLLAVALAKRWHREHSAPGEALVQVEIEFLMELPRIDPQRRRLGRFLEHVEEISGP